MEQLDQRGEMILKALVEEYVRVAEPVGSRTISKRIPLDISSATIRNVMSDLEELDYLYQPHTSSGRVPTSRGFRYYVNRLMVLRELDEEDKEPISSQVSKADSDVMETLKDTSRSLSDLLKHASIVIAPGPDQMVLKHISFIKISSEKILVILVGRSGMIQNRVILYNQDISQDELNKISNYLNEEIVDNRTISEIRKTIMKELRKEKARYNRLVKKALNFGGEALGQPEAHVIVEGQSKIFEQPEFIEDLSKLKQVMRSFEEKSTLLKLLDRAMDFEGLQITIGNENIIDDFKEMSIIAAGYRRSDSTIGKIGIIGPVRMDYGFVIPFVDYAARMLTFIFEEK